MAAISASAFAYLRVIGRIRRSLSEESALTLVHSLVLSRIHFCASIYNGASSANLRRLQRIMNAAIRLITGKRRSDSVQEDLTKRGSPCANQRCRQVAKPRGGNVEKCRLLPRCLPRLFTTWQLPLPCHAPATFQKTTQRPFPQAARAEDRSTSIRNTRRTPDPLGHLGRDGSRELILK